MEYIFQQWTTYEIYFLSGTHLTNRVENMLNAPTHMQNLHWSHLRVDFSKFSRPEENDARAQLCPWMFKKLVSPCAVQVLRHLSLRSYTQHQDERSEGFVSVSVLSLCFWEWDLAGDTEPKSKTQLPTVCWVCSMIEQLSCTVVGFWVSQLVLNKIKIFV